MPFDIPVYRAEAEAGLAGQVRASASVAYLAPAAESPHRPPCEAQFLRRAAARLRGRVKGADSGQPDLHYLTSLLVSTGWNLNDDVFDRAEVWAARHSPEDKPFNYEHACDDIIGHITGCWPVAEGGAGGVGPPLDDSVTIDDLPPKYHVLTSSVLYKFWEDAALQERMDGILAELPQGGWYVSMEALFRGFDYALLGPPVGGQGVAASTEGGPGGASAPSMSVVARCEKTAFLTKHLRAYKGSGTYGPYKVGRLLRHITFSGKGLVRKPANPESVIFAAATATTYFVGGASAPGYATTQIEQGENHTMATADDTGTGAQAQVQVQKLQEQVQSLKAALKASEDAASAAAAERASLRADVERLTALVAAAAEKVRAESEAMASWKAKAEEAQDELAKALAEKRRAGRVATLRAAYDCDDAKASELADKLSALDDDAFGAHADYMAEKLAEYRKGGSAPPAPPGGNTTTPAPAAGVRQPPTQTDKPAPMGGKPRLVKTTTAGLDGALDGAQPDPDPALTASVTDPGVEKVRAAIADFMAESAFGLNGQAEEEK